MRGEQREAEFTEFYLARRSSLRRTAYVIVRDWHIAEDLTQQSMVKLYKAWPRMRVETLEAYARRVVVNECLSYLRRTREVPLLSLPDNVDWQGNESRLDLGAALGLLPPRQRAIIALRFLDDQSVNDVARVLSITNGTVKSQTSKALATLRAHLPSLVFAEEY